MQRKSPWIHISRSHIGNYSGAPYRTQPAVEHLDGRFRDEVVCLFSLGETNPRRPFQAYRASVGIAHEKDG
jgi:hypothetical protein